MKNEKSSVLTSEMIICCTEYLPRSKGIETEFTVYCYGSAYHTGLSNRISARQTPPVFKAQGRC